MSRGSVCLGGRIKVLRFCLEAWRLGVKIVVGGGFEKSRLEKPYHLTTLPPYFQPSRTSFRKQFFRLPCNPLEAVRNHGFQDSGQTPLGSRDNYCNYEKNAVTLHSEIRDGHRFRPKSSGQKRQTLFPSCESYGQICTHKSETPNAYSLSMMRSDEDSLRTL